MRKSYGLVGMELQFPDQLWSAFCYRPFTWGF
jgi:hypothetical protein